MKLCAVCYHMGMKFSILSWMWICHKIVYFRIKCVTSGHIITSAITVVRELEEAHFVQCISGYLGLPVKWHCIDFMRYWSPDKFESITERQVMMISLTKMREKRVEWIHFQVLCIAPKWFDWFSLMVNWLVCVCVGWNWNGRKATITALKRLIYFEILCCWKWCCCHCHIVCNHALTVKVLHNP